MSNLSSVRLDVKINKSKNIIATFRIESDFPLEVAAGEIATKNGAKRLIR